MVGKSRIRAGVASLVWAAISGATSLDAQSPTCLSADGGNRNISISSHSGRDNNVTRVKFETSRCKVSMELTGGVRIAGDMSGFSSIPMGGKVEIDSRDDDHRRELTLSPASNGFAYVYKVDGDRREWDNDGKAWLSSIITLLVRQGGFAADERVDYLLSSKGVNGVFEEIALLESDHTQRTYLTKLLAKTTLNPGAVRTFLNVAQRELQSDHELAEVLVAVATRYRFTDESRAAFIQATSSIESDHEHRRTLTAVLKNGGLNSRDVAAVLSSAKGIASDYEKAELLVGVASRYALDQSIRTAYLDAARGIASDHEQRRAFTALLNEGGLSAAEFADVVDATSSLSSNYERSQVLQLVSANTDLSDSRLQQAYVKAVTALTSDHEIRQLLSVLLKKDRLTSGALDAVLASTARVRSDHERAEILLQVVQRHNLTAAQRAQVVRLTEEMGSGHDRGRVATVLMKQMNN